MRLLRVLSILALMATLLPAMLPSKTVEAAVSTSVQPFTAPLGLTDIACTSASRCYVVSTLGYGSVTPITITNGVASAGTPITPEIAMAALRFTVMGGIACASPNICFSVGRMHYSEAGEHGISWSNAGGMTATVIEDDGAVHDDDTRYVDGTSFLNGIDCPSATNCYVVGNASDEAIVLSVNVDGTSYSPEDVNPVTGATSLTSIACPTSTACYGVGEGPSGGVIVPFTVENRTANDGVAQPVAGTRRLTGIACPTASSCFVTGEASGSGIVASVAIGPGTATMGPIQVMGGTTAMSGIACPNPSTCYATGEGENGGVVAQFAILNTQVQPVAGVLGLGAIACPSAICYALGFSAEPGQGVVNKLATFTPQALIETNVTISSTANPSTYGEPATFTAVVAPTSGTALPGGTVQFAIDGVDFGSPVAVTFANGQNQAAITGPRLGAGAHTITATYSGDAVYAGSDAPAITQTVQRALLTIAADDKTVVEGTDIPTLSYSASGFVVGDTAAVLEGAPSLSTTATSGSLPGDYPITIEQGTLAAESYHFEFVDGTLTISSGNRAPTANAGTDQTVVEGTTVLLSGAGSIDLDQDMLSYAWDVVSQTGPAISLLSADAETSSFLALDDGRYTLRLTVSDGIGGEDRDEVVITVENVAPTATFAAPATVNEGSDIELSLSDAVDVSSNDTQAGFRYAFDCGAGYSAFGTSSIASCSTSDDGSLTVAGKVQDDDGGVSEYTATVTVENVAPTAAFNAPDVVDEGSGITLSLTAPQDPSSADTQTGFSFAFDCGDGYETFGTSSTASCPMTFDDGSLTAKGKIRDDDGGVSEYTAAVTIENVAPTATFTAPDSVDEGNAISIALSDATDAGPADGLAGFSYAFDCGNGYGDFGPSSAASCPTTDNGSLTVAGKVQDDDGGVSAYTATVTVTNVAPTATFHAPVTVDEGQEFGLSLSDPSDPSLADVQAGFSYTFDCGSGYGALGSSSTMACPEAAGGDLTVKGTIQDKDGGEREYTALVSVTNVPPTATINGAPDTGLEGTAIALTSTVTDPGPPEMFSYAWIVTKDDQPFASSSAADFSFTPDDEGSYVVRLVVTDSAGDEGNASVTVAVANVVPTLGDLTSPATNEGELATVSGAISDPGSQDSFTLTIDWGEGEPVDYAYPAGATAFSETHRYLDDNPSGTAADAYPITVLVDDHDGGTTTSNVTHQVANLPPAIEAVRVDGHQVTIVATDAGGSGDRLSYAIDCDGDGVGDGDGNADKWGTDGSFTCPEYTIVIEGTVWTTDDDLGSVARAFQIVDPLDLCANQWNGHLAVSSDGECGHSDVLLRLPEAGAITLCVNTWNGRARYSSTGTCGRAEDQISYPEQSPIGMCVNEWNENVRVAEECRRSERRDWW